MGLFFKTCVVCGEIAENELCADCEKLLLDEEYIHKYRVRVNEKQFNICSLFLYSGIMECVIKSYKLKMHERLKFILRDILQTIIEKEKIDKKKALFIPLPSSKKGLKERGFNQVELVFKNTDLNYCSLLSLNDKHKLKIQKSLNRRERFNYSKDKFVIAENFDISYIQKFDNIILTDDIWTTGASLTSAIKVVDEFFKINNINRNISGLVFAKGGGFLNF